MPEPCKIGFAGTDGRSLLAALETSRAISEKNPGEYRGIVVRGTSAMPAWAEKMGWPVDFIPTADNSVSAYAEALIEAFKNNRLDAALIMPEALLFEGLVDMAEKAGFGGRIIGLDRKAAFLEADKIRAKRFYSQAGLRAAPHWEELDARDYRGVLKWCNWYISQWGGAVLKFPYSAGGKGARIISGTWEIREVYEQLIADYGENYETQFGNKEDWPLLIEAKMSGTEISFTILVDKYGHHVILPTAMDYPERFEGPAGKDNPITGGMGSISPHPMESPALLKLAEDTIARPLVEAMKKEGILRPCVLYPGCFVSFKDNMEPESIRVCEINIRPGEPEFQPVVKRIRNLGPLLQAMTEGNLDRVKPEIREDQISICIAAVTGSGGPKKQKGYPWSCTKGEEVYIDTDYIDRRNITLIPSAMDYADGKYKSDGTRVAYLIANAKVKSGKGRGETAKELREKLYYALENGKVRVFPRENREGNRLAWRKDIGIHFEKAEQLTPQQ